MIRSVASWGPPRHSDLARCSVLVVGLGSVGLDVTVRLAATGVTRLGLMDFDTIKPHNLDPLIGATATDAWLRRRELEFACRCEEVEDCPWPEPVHAADDLVEVHGRREPGGLGGCSV